MAKNRLKKVCDRPGKLEKVKKVLGDYSYEEILELLLDEKLRKPRRKGKAQSKFGRYISKELKDFVFKRANHTCEYKDCSEKRFLEVDHVIPRGKGGGNGAYNLRVLCSTHNQLERVKCFGPRPRGHEEF